MEGTITCRQFTQLLVDEQPRYDKRILSAIRPMDGWIGHVSIGQFPAHSGTSLIQDRFENVYPNTTRPWDVVDYTNCVGQPCAKTYNQIGWGSSRLTYFLEQQNWETPLICFDAILHVTHAKEQFNQIINDILRPATSQIQSMFLRKRALFWAKHKWAAVAGFGSSSSEFVYIWQNDANGNEVFLLTSVLPTSKLTPQMLANRVMPLIREGYMGTSPFRDAELPPFIELVTSMETAWELDHLGGQMGIGGTPSIAGNWRFTNWGDMGKYWRYGFSGQIGNYAVRVDPFEMRFNFVGASGVAGYPYKFQLILPYTNIVSSGAGGAAGLKSEPNSAFELAPYRMSFIWHKQAMEALVQETSQINAQMPFGSRNFAGKWKVVIPHICVNSQGVITPIDNRLENQIQFLANFELAIRPGRTEWSEAIFHLGEPQCVIPIPNCTANPGYPTQSYNSANTPCP